MGGKAPTQEVWMCQKCQTLPKSPSLGAQVPRLAEDGDYQALSELKCRMWARQRGGRSLLAVREIGADRCLMESRITHLPGFTCNHQLLRFPLSSPLLLGLLQGQGQGEGRREIFRFPAKFLELPLILWPIPSWKHNLPVWHDSGRQE